MDYVVTGGTGWLGKNLVQRLLSSGDEVGAVRCLCFENEKEEMTRLFEGRVEFIAGDVKDPKSLSRLFEGKSGATLIHLVGVIHPKLRSREFDLVNYDGTKNTIEAALAAGVRKAVVMSSNSPMGCNPHRDHLFTEESPYAPYMGYGKSKWKMEVYLRNMMQKDGCFPISIIRAPWFYGEGQPARQKEFFEMIRKGKGPIVGGGENKRSMVYIDNLCQGILLAARKEEADNEIFWIADKRPYSMNEIIDTVERLLETDYGQSCHKGRLRLPGVFSEVALCMDWTLQQLGLYHQKIHVLSEMNKTIACSIEKAERVLGYVPEVALEEGMRRSLAEYY